MKIAFVGKGGSGKSSVSWLASETLRTLENKKVLAVDADHNMDLCHIYGITVDESFPTLHRAHSAFREEVGQKEDKRWFEIVLDGRTLPQFTLTPRDPFTSSVTHDLGENLSLMVVGLGAEDILLSGRCAHGHSAPLKYYLPLLSLKDNEACVIDGVAGVDMMNFGLFNGADAVVVVVEPHPNSIRVLKEVKRIAELTQLPIFAIINKARDNSATDEIYAIAGDHVLGALPIDTGVLEYDFENVSTETKDTMRTALSTLSTQTSATKGLERARKFEEKRQLAKA